MYEVVAGGMRILHYLDNWLISAQSRAQEVTETAAHRWNGQAYWARSYWLMHGRAVALMHSPRSH
ncbi:hypothetical protein N1851_032735 [Merluccius polli]|uniref:Uncharacterized protein n=1 Tax=Merluccius polli TaxID=89951 RepID=A0AA47M2N6_MERPO|nr:hypothetical protein N1851_032735 [Merluccius polli]